MTSMTDAAAILEQTFPGLEGDGLEHLVTVACKRLYPPDATVVREEEVGQSFFIIVEGEVRYVTVEIGSYDVVELSANAIGIYEIEWEPEIAGTFNLKTVVDPKGQVLEENKLNNELTIPVEVQEKPRPILYYEIVAIAIIIIITLLYFFREQITGFFRTI